MKVNVLAVKSVWTLLDNPVNIFEKLFPKARK